MTIIVQSILPQTGKLLRAMTVQPDTARRRAINTAIDGWIEAGVWDKLGVLWVLAAHDSQAALLNWKNPGTHTLTVGGSPTFTANQGYQGDGSAALLTGPGWSSVPSLSQDSVSIGVWVTGGTDAAATEFAIGQTTGTGRYWIMPRNTGDTINVRLSDGGTSLGSSTAIAGHYTAVRRGAAEIESYKNGASVATATTASVGVTSQPITLFHNAESFSDFKIPLAYAGGALSDTEVSDLHSIANTLLTAIGAV